MKWSILSSTIPQTTEEICTVLLQNRGISPADQHEFFSPRNPMDLSLTDVEINVEQMKKAVARILLAKEKKEQVIVFGDYDADGVCSTAILWETLYEIGVKALPFIPHREKHGYGMTDRSLDALLAEYSPSLVITVDNGIVAHAAVERLNKAGIDVIVTDHHLPELRSGSSNSQAPSSKHPQYSQPASPAGRLTTHNPQQIYPNAYAIVHTTKLCGATVAWFLARELKREKAPTLLDLCGIATIADQMVLKNANRDFAYYGVRALKETQRVGLLNLFQVSGVDPKELTARTINFSIAPRINAMGRLASALDALRAICTKDQQKSLELMAVLQQTNQERQSLTWEMIDRARTEAAQWENEHLIIVASTEYHDGVIGLIAGKLCEEYHKPAIAISIGEKFAKASARSVDGVNVVELIRKVRDDLLEVGGHPMAAGFGLLPEKVEEVKKKLLACAKSDISPELLIPSIDVEMCISTELVHAETIESLSQFEPFGNGNAEPIFGIQHVQVVQLYALGKEKKHLKLIIRDQKADTISLECIGFGMGNMEQEIQVGDIVDIAGTLSINEWNGRTTVQIVVKDIVRVNG